MVSINELDPRLVADCRSKGIDLEHSLSILNVINSGSESPEEGPTTQGLGARPPKAPELPSPSDTRIVDLGSSPRLCLPLSRAREAFEEFELPLEILEKAKGLGPCKPDEVCFDEELLRNIGRRLYPRTAFGILNGGSATSYADAKKNRAIDQAAFEALKGPFDRLASRFQGKPKGITPAFFKRDGSDGPSFLELKFRALLLEAAAYRSLTGDRESPLLPVFQMSSEGTRQALAQAYDGYRAASFLRPLIEETACDPTQVMDATQPLLAALSPRGKDGKRTIFDRAWGKEHSALPLPGGHGENFRVLKGIYSALRDRGLRFAWLGNVDNSGYTVDPVSLACLALLGRCASFEFSGKSALDVKGGVLVKDGKRLSVRDIGQSISWDEVHEGEARGGRAVFNCATGLFDLDYLVPRLDEIARALPLRVSEQNKEAGLYAQAEQTTWEVLGLMDDPLILAVPRPKRFLPAKMLLETLIASPLGQALQHNEDIPLQLREDAEALRLAMQAILEDRCSTRFD